MLPYTCDAILPAELRYTSLKFRRFARWFRAYRTSYGDACELVAFVRLVGWRAAAQIFHWEKSGLRSAARLYNHAPIFEGSEALHQANLAAQTEEDGLAILRAMQDGGMHPRNKLPEIVKMALKTLRERNSAQRVAELTGLTREQVNYATLGRKRTGMARAKAAASLAVG